MGLFRWIIGSRLHRRGVVAGDGKYGFLVVGTLKHQATIENLCGGKRREGVHRYCAALLQPQPWNPWDRRAVVVYIHNYEVGHLDREDASDLIKALRWRRFADAVCEAEIVGGGTRGHGGTEYFAVRLNASMPFRLYSAQQWERRRARTKSSPRS
jgi:hypothetical protein